MTSFDEMFPNRVDCYLALFQDVVYEHNNNLTYVFEAGQLKRRDRVETVTKIAAMADLVYKILLAGNTSLERCKPVIDYSALLSVFTRYSRDIYGFRRIKAKINNIGTILTQSHREQLEQIISEGADFGFKVPSGNPYIERQAAVLLYWFSVLKPFHISFKQGQQSPPEPFIQSYFNEYFSYFLICLALHTQSVNLNIHEDKEVFMEFLNQLHFRNLSRSSLEFFLPSTKANP